MRVRLKGVINHPVLVIHPKTTWQLIGSFIFCKQNRIVETVGGYVEWRQCFLTNLFYYITTKLKKKK